VVNVFDNTGDISLALWGTASASASSWTPSWTVLLISKPSFNEVHPTRIALSHETLIDVDPDTPDTGWLREFAEGLTKRRHVNQEFPINGE